MKVLDNQKTSVKLIGTFVIVALFTIVVALFGYFKHELDEQWHDNYVL